MLNSNCLGKSVCITVQDGRTCESLPNETVLSALASSGIALTAPCGGQGICGKCGVTLLKGKVKLATGTEIQPGGTFSACRGMALSDITIELPKEDTQGFEKRLPSNANGQTNGQKVFRAGAGIDIGTTTVQLELICLDTGKVLETVSAFNAQRVFGADVMSRINAARNGKTKELFSAINRQISEMLQYCIRAWDLPCIEQCTVSGNTTMLHLFCGIDPSLMGEVPFTPVFLEERTFPGEHFSLPALNVTVLPGISAFIGADIVSGLAFLDIFNKNENSLFVDIGTNGEMALWKKDDKRLLCCSTAAGPCFEGAEISCGMASVPGAINRVYLYAGQPKFDTLGNLPPMGICGSGLIDVMAVMKELSVIDETGLLNDEYVENGFPVTDNIKISQKDIRQFQLAKSAIFSGITVLCKRAGLMGFSQLGSVFIAGGLGYYLNLENAINVGLLPQGFEGKKGGVKQTEVCGNTSLKGAVKNLSDPAFLLYCREIAARAETMEIASANDFAEAFVENMLF